MKKYAFALATLALFSACDTKSKDGTIERATAEQEAIRDVENNNQAKKAEKMEADLAARHRFYAAAEGKFEGDIDVDGDEYKMRVNLVRSIPPYKGERVRQLSEIESDLNNLYFNVQIVQWDGADTNTAVGCRLTQVRPNFSRGFITINSSECPSAYTLYFSKPGRGGEGDAENQAREVADEITNGQTESVRRLVGTIQPSWNAKVYKFKVNRSN